MNTMNNPNKIDDLGVPHDLGNFDMYIYIYSICSGHISTSISHRTDYHLNSCLLGIYGWWMLLVSNGINPHEEYARHWAASSHFCG